jgi:hypothetical protein
MHLVTVGGKPFVASGQGVKGDMGPMGPMGLGY